MDKSQIAIIGAGSMGGAILSGLIKSGLNPTQISVSTKTSSSAENLSNKHKVAAHSTEADPAANSIAVSGADVVVLAVKPNQILSVLGEISSAIKPGALIISIAAGITTSAMQKLLDPTCAVVRAMPNTPSIFGLGVTGIAAGAGVATEQLNKARTLFETIGQVLVVEESMINALSTISGSGPAYVFYFAEALIAAAKKMGFSQADAELMVKGTFLGAATLLSESPDSPEQLRAQVTSPNGTTMQAIARFEQANLEQIFAEATQAALARAIELGTVKE